MRFYKEYIRNVKKSAIISQLHLHHYKEDFMLYSKFTSLLTSSVIDGGNSIIGGSSSAGSSSAATAADATQNAASSGMSLGMLTIMYVLMFGGMYWFWFRPQRKQAKETAAMQKSIGTGDNVLTSSGLYGKVVSVGEDVFVVEFGTNRGVRIPVRKTDIVSIKTPKLTAQSGTEIPETPEKLKKPEKESK